MDAIVFLVFVGVAAFIAYKKVPKFKAFVDKLRSKSAE
jgi:hypothetical protein